jgi:acetyl-CoA carboxylase carboxyl transferase subunit alpha
MRFEQRPIVGRITLLSALVKAYKTSSPFRAGPSVRLFLRTFCTRLSKRFRVACIAGRNYSPPPMKHQLDFEKPIVELQNKLAELKKHPETHSLGISFEEEIRMIEAKIEETRRQIFSNLSAWQRVQLARHPKRPFSLNYFGTAFSSFSELHGDRLYAEDRAIVGGFASLGEQKVMVIGTQKGRDTKENIMRNFGSAHPEGYRKALRLMKMANKFGLPIIALIDTAGAYPGIGAEERHIAEAIAVNLREMMLFEVPIIAVVIGEGGSGGALGIGVADRVLILENAYYSVISPEGCAAILWKDRSAASKAAQALKITAKDLLELKLVDEIVPEPLGGAHTDLLKTSDNLRQHLIAQLEQLLKLPKADRLKQRYAKYRAFGHFEEKPPAPAVAAANPLKKPAARASAKAV